MDLWLGITDAFQVASSRLDCKNKLEIIRKYRVNFSGHYANIFQ